MELNIKKTSEKIIGSLRVPLYVYEKIEKLAHENVVSKQEIVRAILIKLIETKEL